ncbi:hypothetical protein [Streptomyces sp. NPDC086989]|uniref:hypothetical protein n=1 Tax=Streptomyces sp. NPDC086989 TaxID=3365764 RepID=UPI0037F3FE34
MTIFRQCGPYARTTDKASLRQALRLLSVGWRDLRPYVDRSAAPAPAPGTEVPGTSSEYRHAWLTQVASVHRKTG